MVLPFISCVAFRSSLRLEVTAGWLCCNLLFVLSPPHVRIPVYMSKKRLWSLRLWYEGPPSIPSCSLHLYHLPALWQKDKMHYNESQQSPKHRQPSITPTQSGKGAIHRKSALLLRNNTKPKTLIYPSVVSSRAMSNTFKQERWTLQMGLRTKIAYSERPITRIKVPVGYPIMSIEIASWPSTRIGLNTLDWIVCRLLPVYQPSL